MPICEAKIYREPDGQYTWLYFKDGAFVEVGGSNIAALGTAVNAARDKISAEPNIGQAPFVQLLAQTP